MRYLLVFSLVLAVACSNKPGDADPKVEAPGKVGQPAAPTATPVASADRISGEVLEIQNVASYTYLKLKTDSGEEWAAVTKAPVQRGAKVSVVNGALMRNFRSESLNKTFDRIYFGTLIPPGGEPTAGGSSPAGVPGLGTEVAPHPGGMALAAAVGEIKVARAEGDRGRTVAEVHAQAAELAGKDVAVRGKVVKFNANIMGSNWVHIRDGSGSAEGKNADLTVTTADTVAVGDEVLVRGKVAQNKQVGAGYSYAVIVEQATVRK
ncbi:MAG: OB-fold nucleic acid binding domain-containing protein [Candidatus Rokubacteria bacterium]|nr:OB-fold nucleic acid binding domain-containing protein [Candidatus Rokubacteria bacterium]